LTFKVDGATHAATSSVAGFANGILSISGTDASRSTTLGFAVTPTAVGTGTYSLGPLSAANASLSVGNPAAGWQAGVGIRSGPITITALSSTSAAGTFSFSLAPVGGAGAGATARLTSGTFDMALER
jgi:hypothetical protein